MKNGNIRFNYIAIDIKGLKCGKLEGPSCGCLFVCTLTYWCTIFHVAVRFVKGTPENGQSVLNLTLKLVYRVITENKVFNTIAQQ